MTELLVVTKYEIWCNDEAQYVTTLGYQEEPPTVCPNNNTHSVDTNNINEIDTIKENKTIAVDETSGVQGYWDCVNINFTVNKSSVGSGLTEFDYSFPYPIRAFDIKLQVSSDNVGDILNASSAPDTDMGLIIPGINDILADLNPSDTVIDVDEPFLAYIRVGFLVKVKNNIDEKELGKCVNIDNISKQITVSESAGLLFTVLTGSKILFSIPRITDFKFVNAGTIILGESNLGGSLVPANTVGRFKYKNFQDVDKEMNVVVVYMF